MARRRTGRRSTRTSASGGRGRLPRRLTPALVLLLLLGAGAVALERSAALPEPAAAAVREAEVWLAPVLREFGIELPALGAEWPPVPLRRDDRAAVAEALALLEGLSVALERPQGYAREDWPHWLDLDGDCVNVRHEVLAQESLEPVSLSADGCSVRGGLWRGAFTGGTVRDPDALDVDHLVPLAEAHRSGGHAWSRERRAAFANDLDDPRSLIAVSASANRSKSDQGPEEWLPPEPGYRCRYAADWVAVKARWDLSVDERERVTLGNLLRDCARP